MSRVLVIREMAKRFAPASSTTKGIGRHINWSTNEVLKEQ